MTSGRKAFTLIELVVALGITAVIGYFFVSIGRDFAIAWDNVGNSVARETEARGALDAITRDFESAFFREGSDVMFAIDVLDDNSNAGAKWEAGSAERPSADGFDTTNHEYGWAGGWVRLICASPSLNAVGYQIIRSTIKDTIGLPRYMLYRNVVTVEDTVDNSISSGFDLTSVVYTTNGDVITPKRPNILAVNVVDFGARLYVYEDPATDSSLDDAPDGLRLIFPADASSRLETTIPTGLWHRANTFLGTTYENRYPDVVEIFIRILDEKGTSELSAMEESGLNDQWEEIVADNSKLYRRFIAVRGKGGL